MDFWTAFPYWGIIVIILLNSWLVSRMKIRFDDDQEDEQELPNHKE